MTDLLVWLWRVWLLVGLALLLASIGFWIQREHRAFLAAFASGAAVFVAAAAWGAPV